MLVPVEMDASCRTIVVSCRAEGVKISMVMAMVMRVKLVPTCPQVEVAAK